LRIVCRAGLPESFVSIGNKTDNIQNLEFLEAFHRFPNASTISIATANVTVQ